MLMLAGQLLAQTRRLIRDNLSSQHSDLDPNERANYEYWSDADVLAALSDSVLRWQLDHRKEFCKEQFYALSEEDMEEDTTTAILPLPESFFQAEQLDGELSTGQWYRFELVNQSQGPQRFESPYFIVYPDEGYQFQVFQIPYSISRLRLTYVRALPDFQTIGDKIPTSINNPDALTWIKADAAKHLMAERNEINPAVERLAAGSALNYDRTGGRNASQMRVVTRFEQRGLYQALRKRQRSL